MRRRPCSRKVSKVKDEAAVLSTDTRLRLGEAALADRQHVVQLVAYGVCQGEQRGKVDASRGMPDTLVGQCEKVRLRAGR
jgi:hypothetical protein